MCKPEVILPAVSVVAGGKCPRNGLAMVCLERKGGSAHYNLWASIGVRRRACVGTVHDDVSGLAHQYARHLGDQRQGFHQEHPVRRSLGVDAWQAANSSGLVLFGWLLKHALSRVRHGVNIAITLRIKPITPGSANAARPIRSWDVD